MENSPNEKRLREYDEMGEPSPKKLKSELDNRKDDESNEDNDSSDGESNEDNDSSDGESNGDNDSSDDESNEDNDENEQQNDLRSREEHHFLRLFTYVLNTIIAIKKVSNYDVSETIPPLKNSFKPTQTFHKFDFSQWKNICAFLYRYASHGAGFARYRILNGIRNCQVVKKCLQKADLNVICLGSGAGNDAVGFCSALSELQFPKSLKLFLVDRFKEWSLCTKLAKVFIEEENFGKVSELFQNTKVKLSFIHCDLPGDLESDKKYFKILGKADVIVMSKFLTSLDTSDNGKHENAIFQSLHEHMKDDALILVNDKIKFCNVQLNGFRYIYTWSENMEDNYKSTALAEGRFNSDDEIVSILPAYVIVKDST